MVIEESLKTMLAGMKDPFPDVIVVANGCTDDTAARARRFEPRVRVIELEQGSKPLALNTGNEAAIAFPRLFVDADVQVTFTTLEAVAEVLASDRPLVAAPKLAVELSGSTTPVRMYYRIWTALPYVTDRMVGSGFYGLSRAGLERIGRFPDVIGDDTFVKRQFSREETVSIERDASGQKAEFTIKPPRSLASLIQIEVRRYSGNQQVTALIADSVRGPLGHRRALVVMARDPREWPSLLVYGWVKLASRRRFRAAVRRGTAGLWLRDETSRAPSRGD
jgi:glycosyltransferase involved in cell wall biosynthesis